MKSQNLFINILAILVVISLAFTGCSSMPLKSNHNQQLTQEQEETDKTIAKIFQSEKKKERILKWQQ